MGLSHFTGSCLKHKTRRNEQNQHHGKMEITKTAHNFIERRITKVKTILHTPIIPICS